MKIINKYLAEQPEHGHYIVCLQRLKAIERLSKRIFVFTIIEAIAMGFMTIFGLHIGVISIVASLFGGTFSIGYLSVQILEIITIPLLAFDSCGKHKLYNIIVFAIHCIIIMFCLFEGFQGIMTDVFLIGLIGAIITYPSINAYFDYEQLKQTEGFPYFSNFLANAEDNPEYVSDYQKKYKRK